MEACPLLMAATELLPVCSPILTVGSQTLPILMPILSICSEIMPISSPVLAKGPLVLPHILTVGSHVSVVLPKTDTSFKRWITPETPPQTRRSCRIGPQNGPLERTKTDKIRGTYSSRRYTFSGLAGHKKTVEGTYSPSINSGGS
jgi:hypothetical protein